MPEVDSNDEEHLQTADMDNPVWSEEPVPDSPGIPVYPPYTQTRNPTPQPNQVEMPVTLLQ